MSTENTVLAKLKEINSEASFSVEGRDRVQSSTGETYFYKTTTTLGEQFKGEAESLRLLSIAAPGLAPNLISCHENDNGQTLFISEYLNLGAGGLSQAGYEELAWRLGLEVHQHKSEKGFGFGVPSYCGATRISHGWFENWAECYSNMIGELLSQLKGKGSRYANLCEKGNELRERHVIHPQSKIQFLILIELRGIPPLLGPLHVEPVLLHGDLWVNGNFCVIPTFYLREVVGKCQYEPKDRQTRHF